jgi:hypothetical protein
MRLRAFRAEAGCFPLIAPDEYQGPEPRRHSYERSSVRHAGRAFRLGPEHLFVTSEPSAKECRRTLRVIYADGGSCSDQPNYGEFLAEYGSNLNTTNASQAVTIESRSELRSLSKTAML